MGTMENVIRGEQAVSTKENWGRRIVNRLLPAGLEARVRCVALLLNTVAGVFSLVGILAVPEIPLSGRIIGLPCVLALIALWIRGYRRNRFSTAGTILEFLLLCLAGFGTGVSGVLVLVLLSSLMFRSLYGTISTSLVITVGWLFSYQGTFIIAGSFGWFNASNEGATMLDIVLNTVVTGLVMAWLAITMSGIAAVLGRYERLTAREKTMWQAAAAISRAGGTDEIRVLMRDTIRTILDDPEAHVTIVLTPSALSSDDDTPTAQPPQLLRVPLIAHGQPYGAVIIRGHHQPPHDVENAVETLASTCGLALHNVAITDELRHRAYHDPLTGFPNRVALFERADQCRDRIQRQGRGMAILMIDLDGFKQVNDLHGHAAGDELLALLSQRFSGCIRPSDTLARLGGDEFAVLLEGVNHHTDAVPVAERIIEAVNQPITLAGNRVNVGASVGVAVWHNPETVDELLRRADEAMYTAKTGGRNQVRLHTAETPAITASRT
jgi:diguanylate cyclase (GGDEF)-like protein